MDMERKENIRNHLISVYKDRDTVQCLLNRMQKLFEKYRKNGITQEWVNEKDTILITYGDTIQSEKQNHLFTLNEFLNKYVKGVISTVHILPMFPFTSDDGFSVTDYKEIDPRLGTWDDIRRLGEGYSLMFDAVINHISKSSEWFQGFLDRKTPYKDYFIEADQKKDYSLVTRPRALPLLTEFQTKDGEKYVWTTFSEDQIDLNYKNPEVLLEVLDVLLLYAQNGARFIRLDAIGFLWKEDGTTCIHLNETHEVIKIMRLILEEYVPGTILITETNVPHKENIRYFGNGFDEAGLVYQFPLPPLTMYTMLVQNVRKISDWAETLTLPSDKTTFFNFLSSHDGIGVRPVEGILDNNERQILVDATIRHGGKVSYKDNGDGTSSPYELNINYQDALSSPYDFDKVRRDRFLAANMILLSMQGVPGIYIHSFLGMRNDYYGLESSGMNRRINREKFDWKLLDEQLSENSNSGMIYSELLRRIAIRKNHTAFSPIANQRVLRIDDSVFSLIRENTESGERIYVFINVSVQKKQLHIEELYGIDLLTKERIGEKVALTELQSRWILVND